MQTQFGVGNLRYQNIKHTLELLHANRAYFAFALTNNMLARALSCAIRYLAYTHVYCNVMYFVISDTVKGTKCSGINTQLAGAEMRYRCFIYMYFQRRFI